MKGNQIVGKIEFLNALVARNIEQTDLKYFFTEIGRELFPGYPQNLGKDKGGNEGNEKNINYFKFLTAKDTAGLLSENEQDARRRFLNAKEMKGWLNDVQKLERIVTTDIGINICGKGNAATSGA